MKTLSPMLVLLVVAPAQGAPTEWSAEAGLLYRGRGTLSITGDSRVGEAGLAAGAPSYRAPSGTGAAAETADRVYDDGYVRKDPGTDNPNALGGPGWTWNWGLAGAAQYEAGSQSLVFRKSDGEQVTGGAVFSGGLDHAQHPAALGVDLQVRAGLGEGLGGRLSLGAGVRGLWDRERAGPFVTVREVWTREQLVTTDRYQATGITVPTNPPYQGTYDGPGPLLPNRPAQRTTAAGGVLERWEAANRIDFDLDTCFTEVVLTPRVHWRLHDRLEGFLGATLGLSHGRMEVRRAERFESTRTGLVRGWDETFETDEWLLLAGLQAGATVREGPWTVSLSGGYDWLSDDLTVAAGPNPVTYEAGAWTAAVHLGFSF